MAPGGNSVSTADDSVEIIARGSDMWGTADHIQFANKQVTGDFDVQVKVESLVKHRDYHRFVKRTSTFMAHDERGECHVGDTVEIIECRPLSKRKRWRVQRIIGKAVRIDEPQAREGATA